MLQQSHPEIVSDCASAEDAPVLSVVVPMYNEQENIATFYQRI
jgi:hypothetical protein